MNIEKCKPCGEASQNVSPPDGKTENGSPFGLNGFKRPRFFSGQLLTEQDLRRLDNYMVGKQRLYNRHFHDWGVVCGLQVSCDCETNGVIVSPGYALSPMGEDIVVSESVKVDVCKMLCRDGESDDPCAEMNDSSDPDKSDEDQWILSVHYNETLATESYEQQHRDGCNTGVECKSNVICEGYEFALTQAFSRKPAGRAERFPHEGFLGAALECIKPVWVIFTSFVDYIEGETKNAVELSKWLANSKTTLMQNSDIGSKYNCELVTQIENIVIPQVAAEDQNLPATNEQIVVLFDLFEMLFVFIQTCICHALLPPCPQFRKGGVPLAVVTVRKKDCKVLRVCNWNERKLAHTLPNLDYWSSGLLVTLKSSLTNLCCRLIGLGDPVGIKRSTSDKGKAEKAKKLANFNKEDVYYNLLPSDIRRVVGQKQFETVYPLINEVFNKKTNKVELSDISLSLMTLVLSRFDSVITKAKESISEKYKNSDSDK
jgi:hypothetical protein